MGQAMWLLFVALIICAKQIFVPLIFMEQATHKTLFLPQKDLYGNSAQFMSTLGVCACAHVHTHTYTHTNTHTYHEPEEVPIQKQDVLNDRTCC